MLRNGRHVTAPQLTMIETNRAYTQWWPPRHSPTRMDRWISINAFFTPKRHHFSTSLLAIPTSATPSPPLKIYGSLLLVESSLTS